jgi:glucosamine--fructose-6-phosphate aminotransferase (isomerizing)
MLKEIHEQPKVIRDTINSVVKNGKIDFGEHGLTDEEMQEI